LSQHRRASASPYSGERGTPVLRRISTRWKSQIGDRRNNECWHYFGPENALAPFFGGVSDTRPIFFSTHRIRSVSFFLILTKRENPVDPTFSCIKKTKGESGRSLFLKSRKHRGHKSVAFSQGAVSCTRGSQVVVERRPSLGPLGFECSQHRQTPRPSIERIRRKALLPFGSQ